MIKKSANPQGRKLVTTLLILALIAATLLQLEFAHAQTTVETGTHQLLLVGPESYRSAFQSFISFKESQGINAQYVSIESLNQTISDGDFVLGLHDYIAREIDQSGVKYVILVGTYDQVPTKLVYSPSSDLDVADFNYKPTDWYYAVPNWNDSQVGLIGGNIPQIAVGRLPVKNLQELQQTLSKIISIEQSARTGSFVTFQDPNLSADLGLEFDYSMVELNSSSNFSTFTRSLTIDVSFVATYSHGTGGALWTQTGSDKWQPIFSCKDVSNIKSTFGVMYVVACFAGGIDLKEESLARTLITSSSGPSFVIASSRTESLSDYIPSSFWERLFETGNVGDSFVFSLKNYLSNPSVFSTNSKSFQEYNFYLDKVLYGDVSWIIENPTSTSQSKVSSFSIHSNSMLLNANQKEDQYANLGMSSSSILFFSVAIAASLLGGSGIVLRRRSQARCSLSGKV